jgi:hypothetical protein
MTTEVLSVQARVDAQTKVRRALLRGGYVPLANRDKLCALKGWPGLVVDEGVIDGWSDQLRYVATGVRVDGPLLVLDFDIDDAAMLDTIWAALPEGLARLLDSAPMRFGGGEKFALFLRRAAGDAAFGRMVSQGYAPVGDDRLMRVEVFDAGSPRQFGVYGAHSHDEAGGVAREYSWAGGWGLADVPLLGLPEITVDEVKVVLDTASRAMREGGWTYEVETKAGVVGDGPAFDIEDMAVFETQDHGEVCGVAALEALCSVDGPGVRLSASWLEGARAVNKARCIARLNAGDERLQIWESASCRLHRPIDLDIGRKIARLGERLMATGGGADGSRSDKEAGGGGGGGSRLDALLAAIPVGARLFQDSAETEGGSGADPADVDALRAQIVEELLDRYAYWSDGRGFVVDVWKGPDAAMTFASFGVKLAPLAWEEKGKRGVKTINPVDLWKSDVRRLDVGGFRFLPTSRERLVKVDDSIFVNTWERPAWWDAAGGEVEADEATNSVAVDVFRRFLAHLVPDERERAWLTMWLAAKVQRPWLPNCGVVMVAERQGVGRGTLFDMLGGIFGSRHVRPVSAVELIGGGSQSQYTSWLENALLVTCDEVLAGDDAGGAMAWKRRDVYERLKALVDPRPRRVSIVRKGLPNNDADVFASFLLATNNINALPLSPDDRRFAVITNANVKLEDRLGAMAMLEPWRDENGGFGEAFCGAVGSWLREVKVAWNEVRESPRWMVGRERMLQANESDLDGVLENVLRKVEGDFILGHHLRERVARGLEAAGLLHETKGWWSKTQDTLGRLNRFGWRKMDGRQKYAPKAKSDNVAVVFYREDGVGEKAWRQANGQERETLWAGGDPTLRKTNVDLGMKMQERGLRIVDDAG